MKNQHLIYLLFFAFMAAVACNSNKPAGEDQAAAQDTLPLPPADTTPINETGVFMFNYTIANLPAPVKVLDEYATAGLPVDVSLLNPYKSVSKYESGPSKAFNFGIYGIDLAYLVVNKRTPDLLNYYNSSRKLAQELNMAETFDKFTQRFENNSENKDSLMHIIDDVYSNTDQYLRSNERLQTASQILAGSWLEAQYITVNLLRGTERTEANDTLFRHVWNQRFHLDNISKIFDELKGNNEVDMIKTDLDRLLGVYKELKDPADVNKEYIEKLAARLNAVRNKIIK